MSQIILDENGVAPGTPSAAKSVIYPKSDGLWYSKDDAGVETLMSLGGSGLGTGVATALAVNVGTAGAFVVNGGALGTPSSGVGTNLTGIPETAITDGSIFPRLADTNWTTAGALTIQPAAGSNLNVALSTTGDFAVNTSQLYVDTSTGSVGVGATTLDAVGGYTFLDVVSAAAGSMVQVRHTTGPVKGYFIATNAATFIGSRTNHPFSLITNDIARVTVAAAGDVSVLYGIGVTGNLTQDGVLLISSTAPTIASGFGTTPSVTGTRTAAFTVNVGTGGTATGGVLTMPTATTGWICHVENLTAVAANRADQRTVQTGSTTTSITVQNQTISSGAALAWTASDVLKFTCFAY